ncbi:MAG: hypothetical protein LBH43_16980 [Treponema sp.]|jgi:hypothetical protein|nr:hypothetical protein [Treponema sp.]
MGYDEINADEEVNCVVSAIEQRAFRQATKRESMAVRLAALSEIVREMQDQIKNDKELLGA